jgi:hypothetical protein
LVDGEGSVVRFHNRIRHLRRRNDRVCGHNAVRVFLSDLGDEQGAHASASTSTDRMGELESLKAIAGLRFLAHYIKNGVDQLGSLSVMSLGPVITSTSLSEHEVV